MSKRLVFVLAIACVLVSSASANRMEARVTPTRAQLPTIALSDATLARVSAALRERYAFFPTPADAASSTVNPHDTGADLKRAGRIASYVGGRNARGAFSSRRPEGLLVLSTTVSLWRDAAAARGSIAHEISDEKRFAGLKGPGGQFVSSTCSTVRSFDAMMCHERTRPAGGGDLFGTWVVFSVDQIRGGVVMTRSDTVNVDAVVLSLGAKLRHRMLAAVGRRR